MVMAAKIRRKNPMQKKYKRLLVENNGATAERKPEILRINIGNSDVYTADSHKQAEEVSYVLVESSPLLSREISIPRLHSEVMVSESSVRIVVPNFGSISESIDEYSTLVLQEALRTIHSLVSTGTLNEEETVEVPVDAEARVEVEGDKLVIELPVESPVQEVSEEAAEAISEAVSLASLILNEGGVGKMIWDGTKYVLSRAAMVGIPMLIAHLAQNGINIPPEVIEGGAGTINDFISGLGPNLAKLGTWAVENLPGVVGGTIGTGILAKDALSASNKLKKSGDLKQARKDRLQAAFEVAKADGTLPPGVNTLEDYDKQVFTKQENAPRNRLLATLKPEEIVEFKDSKMSPEEFEAFRKLTPEQKIEFRKKNKGRQGFLGIGKKDPINPTEFSAEIQKQEQERIAAEKETAKKAKAEKKQKEAEAAKIAEENKKKQEEADRLAAEEKLKKRVSDFR
jgi:hypothetical protein